MSPKEFFLFVLDSFEYDRNLITIGNIKSFRVREEYFYNLIENFTSSGNTIYDFVDYLDKIFDSDYDLKFNVNTTSSNSCKIMTIHKSKGLEYPICYFAGFYEKFNTQELKEKIIFDNDLGIVIPKIDNFYKDTILKTLLKYNIKKEPFWALFFIILNLHLFVYRLPALLLLLPVLYEHIVLNSY